MIRFRDAAREDVPAIVELLRDDHLGAAREGGDMSIYLNAFDRLRASELQMLVVGAEEDEVVACYQLTLLDGLSLRAARRAQIEGVRVAAHLRGSGVGAAMMRDAEARARAAGCRLVQLTTHRSRTRAHAFYERLGFTASHIGFKRDLT
ncbi:GNAT family N-acetyltransferase [Roseitranquillus sediminis]|uniref:GNAT family N-acetyltransferase n=1 Tax=Roseitranquillus sediminis TaxID=2809051 RepID=UPI001D0C5BE9|nr:GNAT family N-acetyltransferase [Roseitranquillus sediminis]MBM9594899.1 GNAT family N-acetyltransferase [Roseitranquillus sediminis]